MQDPEANFGLADTSITKQLKHYFQKKKKKNAKRVRSKINHMLQHNKKKFDGIFLTLMGKQSLTVSW